MFSSFVSGMNAYAEAHPEAIDEKNKVVLPLTYKDVNMHAMYVVFTRFIGGSDLGPKMSRQSRKQIVVV